MCFIKLFTGTFRYQRIVTQPFSLGNRFTVNSRTNNLNFRGFDSSRFLTLRGGIARFIGYIYICMCVYIYIYIYVCVYIYIYIYNFPRDLESTILSLWTLSLWIDRNG